MEAETEVANAPVEVWPETGDRETLHLAYDEAVRADATCVAWADAQDTKIVAVFSVGAVILALAPTGGVLFAIAAVFWVLGAASLFRAYKMAKFHVSPDPSVLRGEAWLGLSSTEFRVERLRELASSFTVNCDVLSRKATWLQIGFWLTGAEVLFLAVALLFLRT
jgi:hypothetical protein